jgi:hypothetical protein
VSQRSKTALGGAGVDEKALEKALCEAARGAAAVSSDRADLSTERAIARERGAAAAASRRSTWTADIRMPAGVNI